MKFCPECGTLFEQNARFCMECGLDKSTVKLVEPTDQNEPVFVVKEIKPEPVNNVEVPISKPEAELKCQNCGSFLEPGELYCQECGQATSAHEIAVNANFKPVDLPEVIYRPTIPFNQPVAEKVIPSVAALPTETLITPPSEPSKFQPTSNVQQEIKTQTEIPPVKKKKSKLRIPLFFFLFALFVFAVWYGYNTFMDNQQSKIPVTISNMELPPIQEAEPVVPKTEVTETPIEKAPEQPKESTNAKSKLDKELARQKTKEQKKPSQQTATPIQKVNPDLIEKALANAAADKKQTKIIFEVGRNEEAKSKFPKNPTKLVIKRSTMIVRITTDHYNKGMGTSGGGSISIKNSKGNVVGTFTAYGKPGKNGTPDAKWVSEPHKILQEGTYYISDSDMSTWSKSFWGTGFVVVEGYETD